MGHALIWVETLTAALAAVGLVTAWAARRSRRWVRWLVAGGVAAVLLAVAVAGALFVALLPGAWGSYQAWFAASWTAALAAGVVWVLVRGLWRADEAGGPAGRAWNLGRLAAVAGAAAALDVMTVSNLDLAQKIVLARERAEAGARVVTLLPPPVADRDNAAPVYQEAFAALPPPRIGEQKLVRWLTRPEGVTPGDPEVTAFLRDREPGLTLLRKAAAMPGCRFEMDYLAPLRQWGGNTTAILGAARVLSLDARVRASRGETGPALADVAALYGMARHLDDPMLLAALVAAALDHMAGEALADVVSRTRPTAAELAVVRPREMSQQRALLRAVEMERAAFGVPGLAAALETQELGPVDTTRLWERASHLALGSAAYRVFFLPDDLAAHREDTAVVLPLLARPYWEARAELEGRDQAPVRGGPLAQSHRVSLRGYARDAAHLDARRGLARLALAAASFRAATGALPERLDVLPPSHLPAIPTDPFSGAPLRARRDGMVLILYSVGPDGKDDGAAAGSDDVIMRVSER